MKSIGGFTIWNGPPATLFIPSSWHLLFTVTLSPFSRSGRRIHNIALPFSNGHNREGGLMQHSMCTFFCMTSRNKSVQESCLKRNRCNGREDTSRGVNDDLEAVIRDLEIEDEEES